MSKAKSYRSFTHAHDEQFHVSFNTPRYHNWANKPASFVELYEDNRSSITPPVSLNDMGDVNMLTRADLPGNSWAVVNV